MEDTYHVCVECPLYDQMRARMYRLLRAHGFDFSKIRDLECMYRCMLCVSDAKHVRAVGRFLADCLAARDIFLNKPSSVWFSKARMDALKSCVQSAPVTLQLSCDVLRDVCQCDVSLCQPLSHHLNKIWLAYTRTQQT